MSTKTAIQSMPLSVERPRGQLYFFRRLLPVALAVRLIYGAVVQLVPDEAYYWVWSRHLAAGYFDHPPMIALVIWIGTHVLGSTELGVRLVPAVMSVGAMAMIVALARRLVSHEHATAWVALVWLTSPLMLALGIVCTPDTPAMFFSVCGLACAALIARRDDEPEHSAGGPNTPRLWLLFGLSCGLAMVSKYTAVLLPAGVAMAMLLSRKGRSHYRRPWIYLSGVIALLVFSPVIWWNAKHGWVSFLYQIHHGVAGSHPQTGASTAVHTLVRVFTDLGVYFGEQALVWTPILFVIALIVLWNGWRHYRTLPQVDRVLLWSGTLPLAFFAVAMVSSHRTEANWPAFAYVPISLLTGRWLAAKWDGRRVGWAHGGINIAVAGLVGMLVFAAPPVTRTLAREFHVPHGVTDLLGWREYGRWLGNQSAQVGAPVMTNRHQDAGEASFYMQGQPEVWCVGIGSRPTAFDYFDEPPDFAKIPGIIWVGGNSELFEKHYGYTEIARINYTATTARNPRVFVSFVLVKSQR